jgi:hypothetical protein
VFVDPLSDLVSVPLAESSVLGLSEVSVVFASGSADLPNAL